MPPLFAVDVPLDSIWTLLIGAITAVLGTVGFLSKAYISKFFDIRMKRLEGLNAAGHPLVDLGNGSGKIRQDYYEDFIRLAKFSKQRDRLKDPLKFPNVERMLLLVGSNCGGLPDLSKPYTVIAQDSWSRDESRNPEDSYNFRLIVDSGYCTMLAEMIRAGRSVQTTAKMEPSQLKKYYLTEGVFQSVVYLLNIDQSANSILFLSVASYTKEFEETELFKMDMHVDRLRSILCRTADGSDLHPALKSKEVSP